MVLFWIDNPSDPNHGYYQVGYDVSSTGSVGGGELHSFVPKKAMKNNTFKEMEILTSKNLFHRLRWEENR